MLKLILQMKGTDWNWMEPELAKMIRKHFQIHVNKKSRRFDSAGFNLSLNKTLFAKFLNRNNPLI